MTTPCQQHEEECAAGHLPVGTRIRFDTQIVWEQHRRIADRLPYLTQEAGTMGTIVGHGRFGNAYHHKIRIEGTGEVFPYPYDAALTVIAQPPAQRERKAE